MGIKVVIFTESNFLDNETESKLCKIFYFLKVGINKAIEEAIGDCNLIELKARKIS